MKQPLFLNDLPDDFGKRGKAFTPYKNYGSQAKEFFHRHASEAGLALGLISLAMAVA